MSICEFSINVESKCGTCKYFRRYDKTSIFGECINDKARIRNRIYRSEMTKACSWKGKK